MSFPPSPERRATRVVANEKLSPTIFRLHLERGDFDFQAGKEIMVHGRDATEDRAYSIASGERDPDLELLIRLIPDGALSPQLFALGPGDAIDFTGPFGSFVLRDFLRPILFFATGTGLAPAISFARSYPGLDMTILHGVRIPEDAFASAEFPGLRYLPCISGPQPGEAFAGRVTEWLRDAAIDPEADFYLCGANPMILDVRKTLKARGVADDRIFTEAYYFW